MSTVQFISHVDHILPTDEHVEYFNGRRNEISLTNCTAVLWDNALFVFVRGQRIRVNVYIPEVRMISEQAVRILRNILQRCR
jgi:hypothetical protein